MLDPRPGVEGWGWRPAQSACLGEGEGQQLPGTDVWVRGCPRGCCRGRATPT